MNKKQLIIISIFFFILAGLFMNISLQWKALCSLDEVSMKNIFACIRGEIFAPYPYIFLGLGSLFIILTLFDFNKIDKN